MKSPAHAIAWEIWRKHRIANGCILALLPISVVLFEGLKIWIPDVRAFRGSPSEAWPLFLFPMLASLMWVMHSFTNSESDPKRGFSGMPARLFALPVRTSFLVAYLALLGVVCIVLTYCAWAGAIWWTTGFALPLRWPLLSLAATMVCFQAVVWGLASFPWIRILVIAAGAFGAMVLNVALSDAWTSASQRESVLSGALLISIPIAGFAAWFGVSAERSGGWRPWEWLALILRALLGAIPRRTRPFATQAQAQFWFEWRRRGFFLSGGLALSVAGAAMMFPIVAMLDSTTTQPLRAVASTILYPLLLSGLAGLGLARSEFWSSEPKLHPFQSVRPISNAELLLAKLKVAGGITLLGWCLAVPLVYWMFSWSKWRELWRLDEVSVRVRQALPDESMAAGMTLLLVALCLVAATWRTMTTALCLGLNGNRRRITVQSVAGCGVFLLIFVGGGWLSERPALLEQMQPGLLLLLILAGALKLVATIRSFATVVRQRLFSRRVLAVLTCLWLATAILFTGFAAVLWTATTLATFFILLALVWLGPAGELFQSIPNLSRNRHR